MLVCYPKLKNGVIHIYEKGKTYVGMREITVNRMFRDLNNKPLTFPNIKLANEFCSDRNDIMRI